jgi:hypothetical protein
VRPDAAMGRGGNPARAWQGLTRLIAEVQPDTEALAAAPVEYVGRRVEELEVAGALLWVYARQREELAAQVERRVGIVAVGRDVLACGVAEGRHDRTTPIERAVREATAAYKR